MRFLLGLSVALAGWLHAGTLDFPETSKTVHAPVDAKTVHLDFAFSNKTDKPVTITKYDAACSCTSVQIAGGKMTYAPGESGVVRANFDMGNFSGEVDKDLLIWVDADAPASPSIRLKIHVDIPTLVAIEPKTLKWDVAAEPQSQTIKINMGERTIRVLSVTASNPAFHYELKTLEEGKRYELQVTPSSTSAPTMCIFRINTDSKVERVQVQQAFATIRKPVAAEKSAPKP